MVTTILVSALVTAMAIMLVFPRTPAAEALHRILVETPVRFIVDLTWKKAGKLALSGAAIGLMMLMGPQMLATMIAIGVDAAVLELVILGWLVSASRQFATAYRSLKRLHSALVALARRLAIRPGRARKPRPKRKSRPQGRKDDDAGPEWAFA